jgi:uridine kinase
MAEVCTYAQLVGEILATSGRVRLVGVDGFGGAGKTTFAARLARAGGGWPVVHTDDFATHDEPLEWWPRMLAQVIEPLSNGVAASYPAYDWVNRQAGSRVTIEPAEVVVIEGVGATRKAWRDRLALRVWVETESDLRLRRGLERDGEDLAEFWRGWRLAEGRYEVEENPAAHADLVVDGNPGHQPHDAEREFVVSARPRAEAVRPR